MDIAAWAKAVIGISFTAGFIILCAMGIIPAEAYCAVGGASITYVVEEWRREQDVKRVSQGSNK